MPTNLNDLEGLSKLDFIGRENLNDLEGVIEDKGLTVAPGSIIDEGIITASAKDDFPVQFVGGLTTPTKGKLGLNLIDYSTLKNNRYNDAQIEEAIKGGYVNDLLKTLTLASGGRVNAMGGGIMDLETARQVMFLGGIAKGIKKVAKKATRAIKKVAKSPIGKAALFASPFLFKSGALGRGLFGITAKGQALRGFPELAAQKGLLYKLGLTQGYGSLMPTALGGITLASALAGATTPKQEDEEFDLDEYYKQVAFNPNAELSKRILGTQFSANGGRIGYAEGSKEPVAKKVMPLLDMDGMEKDYRAEGGFVPIGRMEKADDVPARLSKNEFVFTADAVRNAGEGDVDKGAEVMYNMMKNLEAGGEVSEESQGLEGAREMFQTSQRLGEVI